MQAMVFRKFGAPDVFERADLPDPVPSANDVLVRIAATTVNRLDTFQRNGSRPIKGFPFTAGLEAAGTVVADSNGFAAGDRVLTTRALAAGGGYASMLAIPAESLVRIPDGVTFEQAAAAGLAASTAWTSLFDLGKMGMGERVLIQAGASGVGTAQIQFVKMSGGWVVATAGSDEKAEKVRALGADLAINHRTTHIGAAVRDAGGVNLVMENTGGTLAESLIACLPDSRIVLIGNAGGREATVDTQDWRLKRVTVIGGGAMAASPKDERAMLESIAAGNFKPIIAQSLPIEQVAEAHRLIEANAVFGKIVLLHQW